MTSRPPARTTTATADRPIPADSRAFTAAAGLTAPCPPARITNDATNDGEERPANSKEPLR